MEKDIDKIVQDAASNVACETSDVSKETLLDIKDQLLGLSKKSDDSFIYELVKKVTSKEGLKNGKNK